MRCNQLDITNPRVHLEKIWGIFTAAMDNPSQAALVRLEEAIAAYRKEKHSDLSAEDLFYQNLLDAVEISGEWVTPTHHQNRFPDMK